MDGETIRLMVVACGAIAAGLGGAIIAGAFNSRNTLATIEAAREAAESQREHDRQLEHTQWLRDRKVDLYMTYTRKLHGVDTIIAAMKDGIEKSEVGHVTELVKELFDLALPMRMLAPMNVSKTAHEVTLALREIVIATPSALRIAPKSHEPYEQAAATFHDRMLLLEMQMSVDLGVEAVLD